MSEVDTEFEVSNGEEIFEENIVLENEVLQDNSGIWKTYFGVWKKCFNFKGRSNRTEYFVFNAINSAVYLLMMFLGLCFSGIVALPQSRFLFVVMGFFLIFLSFSCVTIPLVLVFYKTIKLTSYLIARIKKIPLEKVFNRRNFWISFGCSIALAALSFLLPKQQILFMISYGFIVVFYFLSSLALWVRRFHDLNKGILFSVLPYFFLFFLAFALSFAFFRVQEYDVLKILVSSMLIVSAGLLVIFFLVCFVLLFFKGTKGDNKYGTQTAQHKRYVSVFGALLTGLCFFVSIYALVDMTTSVFSARDMAGKVVQLAKSSVYNPSMDPKYVKLKGGRVLQIGRGRVLFSVDSCWDRLFLGSSGYFNCPRGGKNCIFEIGS